MENLFIYLVKGSFAIAKQTNVNDHVTVSTCHDLNFNLITNRARTFV